MEGMYDQDWSVIAYDHIPSQNYFKECAFRVSSINLDKRKNKIAYIPGSGDAVPMSLEEMGYSVERIERNEILEKELSQFECIIIGIRAFNLDYALEKGHKKLMKYIENWWSFDCSIQHLSQFENRANRPLSLFTVSFASDG